MYRTYISTRDNRSNANVTDYMRKVLGYWKRYFIIISSSITIIIINDVPITVTLSRITLPCTL